MALGLWVRKGWGRGGVAASTGSTRVYRIVVGGFGRGFGQIGGLVLLPSPAFLPRWEGWAGSVRRRLRCRGGRFCCPPLIGEDLRLRRQVCVLLNTGV